MKSGRLLKPAQTGPRNTLSRGGLAKLRPFSRLRGFYGGFIRLLPGCCDGSTEILPDPRRTSDHYSLCRMRRVNRTFTGQVLDIYWAFTKAAPDFYRTLPPGSNQIGHPDHRPICSMGKFYLALAEDVPGFYLALNSGCRGFTGPSKRNISRSK